MALFLLRLVAVSTGAPCSSTTGPGANTVRTPGTPLSMNWLQVQLLIYTHPVFAVLQGNRHKYMVKSCSPWLQSWRQVQTVLCSELAHAQLGVVFLFGFLILSLDLKLYSKNKNKQKKLIQLLFTLMEGTQLLQLSKERWEREGATWIRTEIEQAENTRHVNESPLMDWLKIQKKWWEKCGWATKHGNKSAERFGETSN